VGAAHEAGGRQARLDRESKCGLRALGRDRPSASVRDDQRYVLPFRHDRGHGCCPADEKDDDHGDAGPLHHVPDGYPNSLVVLRVAVAHCPGYTAPKPLKLLSTFLRGLEGSD
jgi:hypothetical protein